MTDEKRRNPRFDCVSSRECPIDVEGVSLNANLSNFSRSGISFQSIGPLEVGQTYYLKLSDFNSGKKIPCEIQVIWVQSKQDNQWDCGARIVAMDPADKMDLLDVLYEDWKKEVLN